MWPANYHLLQLPVTCETGPGQHIQNSHLNHYTGVRDIELVTAVRMFVAGSRSATEVRGGIRSFKPLSIGLKPCF